MMVSRSYEKFRKEELILRDRLAIDRTILANERTLLSYIRTSLGVVVVGGTIIHFFQTLTSYIIGGGLVLIGLIVMFVGIKRFLEMRRDMHKLKIYKQ